MEKTVFFLNLPKMFLWPPKYNIPKNLDQDILLAGISESVFFAQTSVVNNEEIEIVWHELLSIMLMYSEEFYIL